MLSLRTTKVNSCNGTSTFVLGDGGIVDPWPFGGAGNVFIGGIVFTAPNLIVPVAAFNDQQLITQLACEMDSAAAIQIINTKVAIYPNRTNHTLKQTPFLHITLHNPTRLAVTVRNADIADSLHIRLPDAEVDDMNVSFAQATISDVALITSSVARANLDIQDSTFGRLSFNTTRIPLSSSNGKLTLTRISKTKTTNNLDISNFQLGYMTVVSSQAGSLSLSTVNVDQLNFTSSTLGSVQLTNVNAGFASMLLAACTVTGTFCVEDSVVASSALDFRATHLGGELQIRRTPFNNSTLRVGGGSISGLSLASLMFSSSTLEIYQSSSSGPLGLVDIDIRAAAFRVEESSLTGGLSVLRSPLQSTTLELTGCNVSSTTSQAAVSFVDSPSSGPTTLSFTNARIKATVSHGILFLRSTVGSGTTLTIANNSISAYGDAVTIDLGAGSILDPWPFDGACNAMVGGASLSAPSLIVSVASFNDQPGLGRVIATIGTVNERVEMIRTRVAPCGSNDGSVSLTVVHASDLSFSMSDSTVSSSLMFKVSEANLPSLNATLERVVCGAATLSLVHCDNVSFFAAASTFSGAFSVVPASRTCVSRFVTRQSKFNSSLSLALLSICGMSLTDSFFGSLLISSSTFDSSAEILFCQFSTLSWNGVSVEPGNVISTTSCTIGQQLSTTSVNLTDTTWTLTNTTISGSGALLSQIVLSNASLYIFGGTLSSVAITGANLSAAKLLLQNTSVASMSVSSSVFNRSTVDLANTTVVSSMSLTASNVTSGSIEVEETKVATMALDSMRFVDAVFSVNASQIQVMGFAGGNVTSSDVLILGSQVSGQLKFKGVGITRSNLAILRSATGPVSIESIAFRNSTFNVSYSNVSSTTSQAAVSFVDSPSSGPTTLNFTNARIKATVSHGILFLRSTVGSGTTLTIANNSISAYGDAVTIDLGAGSILDPWPFDGACNAMVGGASLSAPSLTVSVASFNDQPGLGRVIATIGTVSERVEMTRTRVAPCGSNDGSVSLTVVHASNLSFAMSDTTVSSNLTFKVSEANLPSLSATLERIMCGAATLSLVHCDNVSFSASESTFSGVLVLESIRPYSIVTSIVLRTAVARGISLVGCDSRSLFARSSSLGICSWGQVAALTAEGSNFTSISMVSPFRSNSTSSYLVTQCNVLASLSLSTVNVDQLSFTSSTLGSVQLTNVNAGFASMLLAACTVTGTFCVEDSVVASSALDFRATHLGGELQIRRTPFNNSTLRVGGGSISGLSLASLMFSSSTLEIYQSSSSGPLGLVAVGIRAATLRVIESSLTGGLSVLQSPLQSTALELTGCNVSSTTSQAAVSFVDSPSSGPTTLSFTNARIKATVSHGILFLRSTVGSGTTLTIANNSISAYGDAATIDLGAGSILDPWPFDGACNAMVGGASLSAPSLTVSVASFNDQPGLGRVIATIGTVSERVEMNRTRVAPCGSNDGSVSLTVVHASDLSFVMSDTAVTSNLMFKTSENGLSSLGVVVQNSAVKSLSLAIQSASHATITIGSSALAGALSTRFTNASVQLDSLSLSNVSTVGDASLSSCQRVASVTVERCKIGGSLALASIAALGKFVMVDSSVSGGLYLDHVVMAGSMLLSHVNVASSSGYAARWVASATTVPAIHCISFSSFTGLSGGILFDRESSWLASGSRMTIANSTFRSLVESALSIQLIQYPLSLIISSNTFRCDGNATSGCAIIVLSPRSTSETARLPILFQSNTVSVGALGSSVNITMSSSAAVKQQQLLQFIRNSLSSPLVVHAAAGDEGSLLEEGCNSVGGSLKLLSATSELVPCSTLLVTCDAALPAPRTISTSINTQSASQRTNSNGTSSNSISAVLSRRSISVSDTNTTLGLRSPSVASNATTTQSDEITPPVLEAAATRTETTLMSAAASATVGAAAALGGAAAVEMQALLVLSSMSCASAYVRSLSSSSSWTVTPLALGETNLRYIYGSLAIAFVTGLVHFVIVCTHYWRKKDKKGKDPSATPDFAASLRACRFPHHSMRVWELLLQGLCMQSLLVGFSGAGPSERGIAALVIAALLGGLVGGVRVRAVILSSSKYCEYSLACKLTAPSCLRRLIHAGYWTKSPPERTYGHAVARWRGVKGSWFVSSTILKPMLTSLLAAAPIDLCETRLVLIMIATCLFSLANLWWKPHSCPVSNIATAGSGFFTCAVLGTFLTPTLSPLSVPLVFVVAGWGAAMSVLLGAVVLVMRYRVDPCAKAELRASNPSTSGSGTTKQCGASGFDVTPKQLMLDVLPATQEPSKGATGALAVPLLYKPYDNTETGNGNNVPNQPYYNPLTDAALPWNAASSNEPCIRRDSKSTCGPNSFAMPINLAAGIMQQSYPQWSEAGASALPPFSLASGLVVDRERSIANSYLDPDL